MNLKQLITKINSALTNRSADNIVNPNRKELPSREELAQRLSQLESDLGNDDVRLHGAMCYCPAPPTEVTVKCDECGKEVKMSSLSAKSQSATEYYSRKLEELGYRCEISIVCGACLSESERIIAKDISEQTRKRLKAEGFDFEELFPDRKDTYNDDNTFYYRFSIVFPDGHKHSSIASDTEDFSLLLSFLKNEQIYRGQYGEKLIKGNVHIIERMTGIGLKREV